MTPRRSFWISTLAVFLAAGMLAAPLHAQDADQTERLADGVALIHDKQYDEAAELLEELIEEEPAFVAPSYGSAAYWLGLAYHRADDPESAAEVWAEGFAALESAERFDPRLADRFIRQAFREGASEEDRHRAATAYLQLLAALDTAPPADVEALARPHLETLALILPAPLRSELGLERAADPKAEVRLAPSAGARLVAWWRSQDVAPATRHNERLVEHLARVAYAEQHYRPRNRLDDRAHTYIRYGRPTRQTHVPFDDMAFRNKVLDRSLTLHASDFPKNEFWFYENIDDAAHFLFIDKTGEYRLGEVMDLLPAVIRNGLTSTERGMGKARAVVRTLEEIYRQLSLYHPDFATRYQDVAAFSGLMDEAEVAAQTASAIERNESVIEEDESSSGNPGQQRLNEALSASGPDLSSVGLPGASFPVGRPDLFAQSILMQGHVEDEQALIRREEYVPETYTNAFDYVDPLPVLLRSARFLADDGTTRTEVYWGAPTGALHPSKQVRKHVGKEGYEVQGADFLLVGTVVQKVEDYRERVVNVNRHVFTDLGDTEEAALAPHVYTVEGDTGTYHLAMQWDQYVAMTDAQGNVYDLGPRVKASSYRVDTLQALRADEDVLEMSDLKPMAVINADENLAIDDLLSQAVLYPFQEITPQTPLFLYFEVYHLAFDTDDQTRFTVEYEMTGSRRAGLLRRPKEERISASTEYTGTSRTARESLLLDLSAWEKPGDLTITVRVTDEVTGRQVERSLPFTLVKRG